MAQRRLRIARSPRPYCRPTGSTARIHSRHLVFRTLSTHSLSYPVHLRLTLLRIQCVFPPLRQDLSNLLRSHRTPPIHIHHSLPNKSNTPCTRHPNPTPVPVTCSSPAQIPPPPTPHHPSAVRVIFTTVAKSALKPRPRLTPVSAVARQPTTHRVGTQAETHLAQQASPASRMGVALVQDWLGRVLEGV